MPSYSLVLPPSCSRPALSSQPTISFSVAPSNTGVAKYRPSACAAHPRCVSRIWPTFIRDGTPSGFSTISTGVPSGRYGMSSSGRMRAMTPLLPWRPAIFFPTDSLRIVGIELRAHELLVGEPLQHLLGERRPLAEQALAAEVVEQIRSQRLALQHLDHALLHLVVKDADLVLQVLLHHVELVLLDRLRPVVLLDPLPREDLHADDDSLDARGADEGRIADVAGLLAEDRAQQLLFRRELRFALRRDLAHEDVARLHVGADADDPALVEIAQVGLRDVRDVPGDLLGPELRVASLDLELLDVNRGV